MKTTCGSGSLLLRVKREASSVGKIYGQEMNRTTYNLARMNMILHGVHYADFEIIQEDTLEHPQHTHLKFDAIVANPQHASQNAYSWRYLLNYTRKAEPLLQSRGLPARYISKSAEI